MKSFKYKYQNKNL